MRNIVYLLIFVLVSCKTTKTGNEIKKLDMKTISKGALYGDGAEGIVESNMIVRSESEWNDLVEKMDAANVISSGFKELPVDFSKEMIICVFDKVRGTGGIHINIDEVMLHKKKINVMVSLQEPAPGENVTTIMTQPYHIIKIDKIEEEAEFVRK